MPTFISVIDNIKSTLENDTALDTLCQENFGRAITVLKSFKNRQELDAAQFPVIMITRPQVKKTYLTGAKDGEHTVLLYCGFFCEDSTQALDMLVQLEEAVDDAMLVDTSRGGTAIDSLPGDSANDSGHYHPYYFIVMTVDIHHRR
jgi:hypothetical protein